MSVLSPVSIAICDDEQIDLEEMQLLTKELLDAEGIHSRIVPYESAAALLSAIQGGSEYQILLLDILMEGLDGMDLAFALREQGNVSAIIFVSCNRELALQGYEVSAVRYLAKPLQPDKLQEAPLYCCRTQLTQKEILLPTVDGQRRVVVSDVIYAEPSDRGTVLTLVGGECKTNVKISDLESLLSREQFVFCHRTILVNLSFIQSIRYCELTLKTGQTLPISKHRQTEVRQAFMRYLRR